MDEENSQINKETYKRGPYKRNKLQPKKVDGLYRTKIRAKESREDCEELFNHLCKVREAIKKKFNKSYNRSKVLENIQGQLDFLYKQIIKEKPIEEQLILLQGKVQELEEKLEEAKAEKEQSLDYWRTLIENDRFSE